MNVQEYISSGIVESYVLGFASREECIEFERMCAAYREVYAARNAFEVELEERLLQQKKDPPRALKPRILSEIGMEKEEQLPPIPLAKPTLIPRAGFAKYVAAAALILFGGSVLLNLYLLDQYKKTIAQNKELSELKTQEAGSNQALQARINNYENAMALMSNPFMTEVKMPASPNSPAPSSMATVYWNTESKIVYLLINQLPKPGTDKQYQLWAIEDGKPVNAGVFELGDYLSLIKLKTIAQADAFAITLEKKGGSETPTIDSMYVMGKVSS